MARSVDEKDAHIASTEHHDSMAQHDAEQQMRSQEDNVPIWEAVKRYKLITVVTMLAAFSASLDGYRKVSRNYGLPS